MMQPIGFRWLNTRARILFLVAVLAIAAIAWLGGLGKEEPWDRLAWGTISDWARSAVEGTRTD